jgi:hypothetical protein
MSDPDPKIEIYRMREREWRERALQELPGEQRDACLSLANGYARLLGLLTKLNDGGGGGQVS